jgi:DNA-binding CsgD family transcriptional regulator
MEVSAEYFRHVPTEHRPSVTLAFSRTRSGFGDADHRLAQLTSREVEIMEMVAAGRTNVAIARALDMSPRTVAKHLEHVYRKLGVSNRAAAVASTR